MIRWTGLARWEFDLLFQVALHLPIRGAGEGWRGVRARSEEARSEQASQAEAGRNPSDASGTAQGTPTPRPDARPDLALERGPIKRPERALQKLVRV